MTEPKVGQPAADEPTQPGPPAQPPESSGPAQQGHGTPATEHDPSGVELAIQIANQIAGSSGGRPRPSGTSRAKSRRKVDDDGPNYSGAHPDARDPQPVGNVLNGFIAQRGWRTHLSLRAILTRWPELIGPINAEHCQPEAFTDGVLRVRAESTTWATAMRSMAPQLVAKLNAELGDGAVKRIDVQGPAAPSWKHGIRSVRDGRGPRDTYG